MIVPVTRAVRDEQYEKWSPVAVTLGETTWTVEKYPHKFNLQSQLDQIKVVQAKDMVFAQTVINLYMFNNLDARRIIVDGERELVYMVNKGETVVIPPLPSWGRVKWIFTLGGKDNTSPILRFTFDNLKGEEGDDRPRKRKRTFGLF
jgi:hypothetical protein